jgi:phosphatidylglycerophosphate synthase
MRKIPEHLENPVDNLILNIVDYTMPFFYKLGFTPNGITTLSLFFGLLSVKLIYDQDYLESSLAYFISYIFDCMDGHMARKYKMVSKFGDYYDHIKDMVVGILLVYTIIVKYSSYGGYWKYFPLILFVLFFTMNMHLGCQEIYYHNGSTSDDSLTVTTHLCPVKTKKETENVMIYTKYFNSATVVLFICFAISLCKILDSV